MEFETGRFYNVKEVSENLIKCDNFGNGIIYKYADYKKSGVDEGLRLILQPIGHYAYRVQMSYNIKEK